MSPSTPQLGVPFEIDVAGLAPGEVVTILALPLGLTTNDPPRTATADAGGIARQTSINGNASMPNWFARVTRADGRVAELRFSFSAAAAPPPATAPPPAAPPPVVAPATSSCPTATGPSGTRFFCVFVGFPPNATGHLCFNRTGTPGPFDGCNDLPISADGTFPVGTHDPIAVGTYTYTLTVGAQTQQLSFTVTP